MQQQALELYLYHLSMVEFLASPKQYDEYQGAVLSMLTLKDQFVWEDEILKNHQKKKMEEILTENEMRYVSAGEKERDGELVNAWYDTWAEYCITEKDHLYSRFFIHKIRQIDLLDMDDFFNYQLEKYYNDDFGRFSRFLTLTLRKYAKELLAPEHVVTAEEWIKQKQEEQKQDSSQQEKTGKLKGRPQRTGDDKLTLLNQEQTVLLFHYLQRSKIFYQGDFLTNTQAGQAFHVLTGYSADTIRQKLANTELELINNKKNLTDLDNVFTKIKVLISNELKSKK